MLSVHKSCLTTDTFMCTLVVCVSASLLNVDDDSFSRWSFRLCFPGDIGREIEVTSVLSVFMI